MDRKWKERKFGRRNCYERAEYGPAATDPTYGRLHEKQLVTVQALLENVQSLQQNIPRRRQDYFNNHIVTQTKFHLYGSSALNATASALLLLAKGPEFYKVQKMITQTG